MNRDKRILHGLVNDDYEHPHDKKALDALESTPGIETVGKFITKHTIERIFTIQYTGSYLKVTKQNYPKIYDYLEYASQILDLKKLPELYMQWGYDINAFTVGSENPIVVINSGLIDLCDEDEILFIIGHECGHVKSNHMLYHMMAQVINQVIDAVPGGSVIAAPLQFALYYWSRMSEFTADRAGLLACQNMNAALRAFVKMAGLPKSEYSNVNTDAFVKQSEDFSDLDYEGLNKVVKLISIANASHPWTVMRGAELLKWSKTGYTQFVPSTRKTIDFDW